MLLNLKKKYINLFKIKFINCFYRKKKEKGRKGKRQKEEFENGTKKLRIRGNASNFEKHKFGVTFSVEIPPNSHGFVQNPFFSDL